MTDRVINESSKRITNPYGGSHKGVDLGWRPDEEQNKVFANCRGVVEEIQTNIPHEKGATGARSWGNYVLIKHDNGMYSRYAHLRTVNVKRGDFVDENTCVGVIGDTGNANGRHLHFEVQTSYSSNSRINPTEYLTKAIYVEPTKPIEPPKTEPTQKPEQPKIEELKVGDRVVVSGRASYDSDGNGPFTATYNGTTDTLYITKITDLNRPRPYHLSKGNTLRNQDRGWVSKAQIKKL